LHIIHFLNLGNDQADITADVCILGAGAAGIYLACRLVELGVSVALLEAGDNACADSVSIGMEANMTQANYSGATKGRAFGLGGTTSLWGGQLVPHVALDIQQEAANEFDPWSHIVDVTSQYSGQVKHALGIGNSAASEAFVDTKLGQAKVPLLHSGLNVMASEFLPFRRKNFKFLLEGLPKEAKLQVYLGAVADTYEFSRVGQGANQLGSISVQSGGKKLRVTAHSFVVAAGTIESTRILLEMDATNGNSVIQQGAMVGNYLSDHLSLAIANVESASLPLAARLFAPRFDRGRLRGFRFLEQLVAAGSRRCFAHFIFDNENNGFELAKKLLAGLQSRALPQVSIKEFLTGISGLTGLAWNRVARSRLYIPRGTEMHLQLDIEQAPNVENKITLAKEIDAHGRPVAEISWKICPADYENIEMAAERILTKWPDSAKELPRLHAIDELGIGSKPHDAYHPVGTCRMGEDRESVVSPNLKVHGTTNVFLLSTAVFPTAGSANPTFGMLCFAERLAESLSTEVQLGA
jgi:GMC oxidoreductase/NAD(P)-binding Rossmann-like domain